MIILHCAVILYDILLDDSINKRRVRISRSVRADSHLHLPETGRVFQTLLKIHLHYDYYLLFTTTKLFYYYLLLLLLDGCRRREMGQAADCDAETTE